MTQLTSWAMRHHVSLVALAELQRMLLEPIVTMPTDGAVSEAQVLARARVEASALGIRLWRNNVGAGKLDNGSFVRWGLANESGIMNDRIKSADLIGIKPVLITTAHVGHTIGQFVSREGKPPGWRYTGTTREIAQETWGQMILSLGGDACFMTGPGTFK